MTTDPTIPAPPAPPEVGARERLALALDTDDLVEALRMADQLEPYFAIAKVGLELFSAEGPEAVSALAERGWRVFLDVKLHDIPNTVNKAARVLGALGTSYLTLHAQGGGAMLRAGVEGLREGAMRAGLDPPLALAVTILTSDDGAPPHVLSKRIAAAIEGGCGGFVSAASDVREAKELAPRMLAVVPGIRHEGTDAHDQARAATPQEALAAGADLLVIGRAVTAAPDRVEAAARMAAAVAGSDSRSS
ncbi:MAG TPA: orotidine-5'-phosphate decarboxylase [Acidimicrobiales bacterium]|nr:orotidine-5'-phosphate decarboxylase [Acidimicrobiales bacterium]